MAKSKTAGTRSGRARRGKGEDMTEADANSVEVRAPVMQGDILLPSEEVYRLHRDKIKKSLEAKDSANGKYRKDLEAAQLAGINTDMMLECFKLVRANSPQELINKLSQLNFCFAMEGYPVEITVKDTLIGDEMEMVYRRYFMDGKTGKTLDNPYPVGSDLHAQAARAWRHGMACTMGVGVADADKELDEDAIAAEAKLPPPPDMGDQARAAAH